MQLAKVPLHPTDGRKGTFALRERCPMTPQQFVAKWRAAAVKEKSAYQSHFNDLCELVEHKKPLEENPTGEHFTFEAGAKKTSGAQGFADVWYKDHFALEYKGPDGNLAKAYTQLLQYREALENPPLLIVSDLQTLIIHTNFTNTAKTTTTLTLDDLLTPQGLLTLRNVFFNPTALRPEKTAAQVTEEAATRFAHLAEHLRKWGYAPLPIAHYLIRLLFCLFAEDIDLLPRDLFTRLVQRGSTQPQGFSHQIKQLFHAMSEGDFFGEHQIRYFDGGLFDDDAVLEMDADGLTILHGITALDWSAIEPAIFGTLFTRSLDPSKRAQLGAHYTSREDILLIVEPVLMAPLRREWAQIQAEARNLAQKRDVAPTRSVTSHVQNELRDLVMDFVDKLRDLRVLDPACGSGNFLYICLRLLLDLEKEVSNFCGEVGLQPFFPEVNPTQLYGIEKDEYAHELAQATVWIGYLQWLHENGYGFPSEPILKPLDNIQLMDAILAFDADGKPVEPEWPAADVIVGNPPFLGGNKIRQEFGDQYVGALFSVYSGRVPAFADLVCYWFEKSEGNDRAAAVVSLWTAWLLKSIRGGVNRVVLEKIKRIGDIFWAWIRIEIGSLTVQQYMFP